MGKEVNRFTIRAMAYSSVALASFVVALVLSSELFLVASLVSASLMLLSLSTYPPRARIERTISRKEMFEDQTADIDISLEGKGQMGNIEVFDRLSPMLEIVKGSNLALLPPGSRDFRMTVKAPVRGYHRIGPTLLRRWDPLWLWFKEGGQENRDQLTVFPKMSPSRSRDMLVKELKHRPGDMRLKRVGLGKEFHSIRDYTTTDPFNTINWKATARRGKLLVNQFEAESVTDVMFIVDSRLVSRVGTIRDNPAERSIRFCSSMTSELLRRSNRVGLVIYGSSVNVMKPKGGISTIDSILHMLTGSTPAGQINMGAAITYSLSYLPPHCPVFLLSPLNEDPTIKGAVKQLLERGHRVIVVSPSGIEFERGVYGGKILPKYVLKRIERDNLIKDLRAVGATVVDWDPEDDVVTAMEEVWK